MQKTQSWDYNFSLVSLLHLSVLLFTSTSVRRVGSAWCSLKTRMENRYESQRHRISDGEMEVYEHRYSQFQGITVCRQETRHTISVLVDEQFLHHINSQSYKHPLILL